jgi:hypothetical protein
MWQYTAVVAEHNSRLKEGQEKLTPWTPEEYIAELEALRARNDPAIKV